MPILLIEDEARILSFLTRGLEAEGYSVYGTQDGRTGLGLACKDNWALIVLDLLLPELGGLEVLRGIRHVRPDVPVLILSARDDMPTKLYGFELGASDFMPKPFSFAELLARIRVHLRTYAPPPDDEAKLLRAGKLVLDLARRQVRFGDVVCALSDREFRLLHHLAVHQGEVISRECLLADVWGYSFDPGSNLVDVCIRRLRKKLGPAAPPIETVRRAGYRLAS